MSTYRIAEYRDGNGRNYFRVERRILWFWWVNSPYSMNSLWGLSPLEFDTPEDARNWMKQNEFENRKNQRHLGAVYPVHPETGTNEIGELP